MRQPEVSARRLSAIHVVAGLAPAHGGPSYSVPRLCEALASADVRTTLLSVAAAGGAASEASDRGYRECSSAWDYAQTPLLRSLRRSSGLARALRAGGADIIHNHGLWLMPNVEAGWAAARAAAPLVVSPRGMLAPAALAFSRRRKQAFWALLQSGVVRRSACLHATSESEYREIRAFGLVNPVAIIPNGIDLPAPPVSRARPGGGRTVLSLGRIHPKKGLDQLLYAWADVEPRHPGWRLRVVGPREDGHADELGALAASLGLARVTIDGPLYGDAKWAAYHAADLFVLPSRNENFGVAAAEALAAGTPVVATRGAPWNGLETEACGWWVEPGREALAAALGDAMALPRETLTGMGERGRVWMERDFSWDRVARDMLGVYEWLAGRAGRPATVRLD